MNPLNEISFAVAIGGSLLILYFFIDLGTATVTCWWAVPSYMLAVFINYNKLSYMGYTYL